MIYQDNQFSIDTNTFDRYLTGKGIGKYRYEDTRSKEMTEFTYNELCFTMDTNYGYPSKCVLSESIHKNGFDNTLSTYNNATVRIKELLLSESTEDYCTGIKLLNYYLEDGGHTDLSIGLRACLVSPTSIFSANFADICVKKPCNTTVFLWLFSLISAKLCSKICPRQDTKQPLRKPINHYKLTDMSILAEKELSKTAPEEEAAIKQYQSDEVINNHKMALLGQQKRDTYATLEAIKKWSNIQLLKSGDLYIFDFNSFTDEVFEPLKWSLDYAAEHNAKYFIIDVSTNGGGIIDLRNYILSVMCGNNSHDIKYAMSGNTIHYQSAVDKNLDGKIDNKDDMVKYDFHFSMITSQISYSCGSMTPTIAKQHGIPIIGETSGGGCCNVVTHFLPDGAMYTISGSSILLDDDGSDADNGASPDILMPGADSDYQDFYDIAYIKKELARFYNEPLPTGIYGDADKDGLISSADSLLILRQSVGLENFDEETISLSDVDSNGKITSSDSLAVLRKSVGLSDDNKAGMPFTA